jgi:transcriptional regulator with XRE-family HTH domain
MGYVVANVKRLRSNRGWSLAELSNRLREVGRPIRATGLHRLEAEKRRVDVDDLVTLALALDVSPITLLMPFTAEGQVALTATTENAAQASWHWMQGSRPLSLPEDPAEAPYEIASFQRRSLPAELRTDLLALGRGIAEELADIRAVASTSPTALRSQ